MAKHHDGLIYTMVLASAADDDMTDSELLTIGEIVRHLPVFRDYSDADLSGALADCADLLAEEDGLDRAIDFIKGGLPTHLRETAYALACDIVAADGEASQEELRLLEMFRHRLDIDRLTAAAIERGARARHLTALRAEWGWLEHSPLSFRKSLLRPTRAGLRPAPTFPTTV